MKKTRTQSVAAMLALLAALATCSSLFAYDSTVAQTMAQWRQHILTRGNLGGIELDCEQYRSLVAMGPACLPEVFQVFREESDPHVLYYYAILVRRVAHFDVFRYSETPLRIGDQEFKYDGERPFLSMQIGDGAPSSPASAVLMRDKLMEWWSRKASFLQREDAETAVRAITGRDERQYQQFDKKRAREFSKLTGYGIYNLPYYLDIIQEDNNPIVFSEFLRITNHPEYQVLELTGDLGANGRAVNAKYATRESKLDVICEWWSQSGAAYAVLEDLHREIDKRIQVTCRDRTPRN